MVGVMEQEKIPVGYKQTEVGLIPVDWEVSELSSFVSALEAGVSVNSIESMDEFGHGKSVLKTSKYQNKITTTIACKGNWRT
mgnify:CR=1 FL=1